MLHEPISLSHLFEHDALSDVLNNVDIFNGVWIPFLAGIFCYWWNNCFICMHFCCLAAVLIFLFKKLSILFVLFVMFLMY